jgi:ABC-type branched-subunit amino acid transport system ATPase component
LAIAAAGPNIRNQSVAHPTVIVLDCSYSMAAGINGDTAQKRALDDIKKLIMVLNKICDNGTTIIIIEHNLDLIKCADYLIDLGPDGGENGGQIVASGTPMQVAESKNSYTGQYLKKIFNQ